MAILQAERRVTLASRAEELVTSVVLGDAGLAIASVMIIIW